MKAVIVASAVMACAVAASADTLANWTFETSIPTTAGPHAAELGNNAASSFASGFHTDAGVVYSNPAGNGSAESFSANFWNTVGDYYQFTTSTVGYTSITVGWDQNRSGTGPATFDLEWSSNGTTFSTLVNDYVVGAATWSSGSPVPGSVFAAVALPAGANNLPTLWIRMTNQVAAATGGTNRIDNVKIDGVVPTPGALMLAGVAGLAATRRRR